MSVITRKMLESHVKVQYTNCNIFDILTLFLKMLMSVCLRLSTHVTIPQELNASTQLGALNVTV